MMYKSTLLYRSVLIPPWLQASLPSLTMCIVHVYSKESLTMVVKSIIVVLSSVIISTHDHNLVLQSAKAHILVIEALSLFKESVELMHN